MALVNAGNVIVVSGTGDQTLKGPLTIVGITVPTAGTAILKKGSTTLVTLSAGHYNINVRSITDLIINGACTLYLK
jgi:hypothetical protein